MAVREPEGNLFGRHRVMQPHEDVSEHTGKDVEGMPAEEGMDTSDVAERLDEDPEEQKNFTEMDPDYDAEDR